MVRTSSGYGLIEFENVQAIGKVYLLIPIPKCVALGEGADISSNGPGQLRISATPQTQRIEISMMQHCMERMVDFAQWRFHRYTRPGN